VQKYYIVTTHFLVGKNQCEIVTIDISFKAEYMAKDGFDPFQLAYSVWVNKVAETITLPVKDWPDTK